MQPTRAKTDDQLKGAAIDVTYEINRFRQACDRVKQNQSRASNVSYWSALNNPGQQVPNYSLGQNLATGLWPKAQRTASSSDDDGFLDVEVLLCHFRVLVDFFYPKQARLDDVLASDFGLSIPGTIPQWAEDWRDQCNKMVAHLTYTRTDRRENYAHHVENLETNISNMEQLISTFLTGISAQRGAWFSVLLAPVEMQARTIIASTSIPC
jgi:hypothetical protein